MKQSSLEFFCDRHTGASQPYHTPVRWWLADLTELNNCWCGERATWARLIYGDSSDDKRAD